MSKDNQPIEEPFNTKGFGLVNWVIIIGIGIFLFLVSTYALLLLIFGMSPTFAASMTDKRYGNCASRTIGAMNFIGLVPFLSDLINSNDPAETAKIIVQSPQSWLFIYGCASIGWIMIWIIPQITSAIFSIKAENKITVIESLQKRLEDEWGTEIKEIAQKSDFSKKIEEHNAKKD